MILHEEDITQILFGLGRIELLRTDREIGPPVLQVLVQLGENRGIEELEERLVVQVELRKLILHRPVPASRVLIKVIRAGDLTAAGFAAMQGNIFFNI